MLKKYYIEVQPKMQQNQMSNLLTILVHMLQNLFQKK